MGQYLERFKEPSDLERLWIDYVTALARGPKLIQIVRLPSLQSGSIPLSSEPPNGAEALRRVLENFRNQKLVWVTDVEAVMAVAGEKQ